MGTIPSKISVLQSEGSEVSGHLLVGNPVLAPIRRLVVLVPNVEVDETEMARQVWELAAPAGLAVLFFSLCTDLANEPHINLRLTTLAALTRDSRICVDTHVEFGRNWIRGIKTIFDSGDVIVCYAEQSVGIGHRPISQALEASYIPVWTLNGLHQTIPARRNWLVEFIFWVVSLTIIFGFFWLQIQLLNFSQIWTKNIYLLVSVFAEVGLLWGWHAVSS